MYICLYIRNIRFSQNINCTYNVPLSNSGWYLYKLNKLHCNKILRSANL